MIKNFEKLLEDYQKKLKKALRHLDYSYKKVLRLSVEVEKLDDETLEVWESFSSRFSRVADLFLTKYVRTFVLKNDPGFEGTLRDFVNQGEKLGIVDHASAWMAIRELRNISAHDYSEEYLTEYFKQIRSEAPRLLALDQRIP